MFYNYLHLIKQILLHITQQKFIHIHKFNFYSLTCVNDTKVLLTPGLKQIFDNKIEKLLKERKKLLHDSEWDRTPRRRVR